MASGKRGESSYFCGPTVDAAGRDRLGHAGPNMETFNLRIGEFLNKITMLKDLNINPDGPTELRAVNKLLAGEVKALSLKVEQLQHQLYGANRNRFGSKSETLDQLNLNLA